MNLNQIIGKQFLFGTIEKSVRLSHLKDCRNRPKNICMFWSWRHKLFPTQVGTTLPHWVTYIRRQCTLLIEKVVVIFQKRIKGYSCTSHCLKFKWITTIIIVTLAFDLWCFFFSTNSIFLFRCDLFGFCRTPWWRVPILFLVLRQPLVDFQAIVKE